MSRLSNDNRKQISNMLAHKVKCKEIAEVIGFDPITIAKEITKKFYF